MQVVVQKSTVCIVEELARAWFWRIRFDLDSICIKLGIKTVCRLRDITSEPIFFTQYTLRTNGNQLCTLKTVTCTFMYKYRRYAILCRVTRFRWDEFQLHPHANQIWNYWGLVCLSSMYIFRSNSMFIALLFSEYSNFGEYVNFIPRRGWVFPSRKSSLSIWWC